MMKQKCLMKSISGTKELGETGVTFVDDILAIDLDRPGSPLAASAAGPRDEARMYAVPHRHSPPKVQEKEVARIPWTVMDNDLNATSVDPHPT